MFKLLFFAACVFLFAMSLRSFSKSAEQRAKSRADLYFAEKIREEAKAIRLQNQLQEMEISNTKDRLETTDNHIDRSKVIDEESDLAPIQNTSLKELELDSSALAFINKLQPKQEEIEIQEPTIYEKPSTWFNFPEVDLYMNERPEKGLYYVAGKVIEKYDNMSAILSDGTGERMIYHHKVGNLSVGDVVITQVEIHKKVWNFVNIWNVQENSQDKDGIAV
ncbi:hypothetical protein ACEK07_30245 [Alcanivoracaceae bacterium MT1]